MRRQALHKCGIGVGVGSAQTMVHMQHGQVLQGATSAQQPRCIRKRARVGPTRNHQQHGRVRMRKVMALDGGAQRVHELFTGARKCLLNL